MKTTGGTLVSIVIVTWNSATVIANCLSSLMCQSYQPCEIIVIDNHSNDHTQTIVSTQFPQVRLHRNDKNIGFAAAVNQGFDIARGDILIELNPDTTVAINWLEPLVTQVCKPNVGLATARIMLIDQPDLINACGNDTSLTGMTFCTDIGKSAETYTNIDAKQVTAVSGAAFAMRRDVYEHIGGFDADYFTYFEDTDLSLRARLAGYDVMLAAQSVVYHHYSFGMNADKLYWVERNRYITFFKLFERRTLLLLLPTLLLGELIAWAFAATRGTQAVQAKWRATRWLLANRDDIEKRRSATQRLRRVSDQQLVRWLVPEILFKQAIHASIAAPLEQIAGFILRVYRACIILPFVSNSKAKIDNA